MFCCWVLLFLLFFHQNIAVLGHASHEVISQLLTALPEAEDVAPTIPNVDPLRTRWYRTDALDTLFPNLPLAPTCLPLGLRFLLRSWLAHKGLLVHTP